MFPVLPIHRLDQEPQQEVTLVDMTCDSDGKIATFIDREGENLAGLCLFMAIPRISPIIWGFSGGSLPGNPGGFT